MQMNSQRRKNVQTTIVALLVARKGGCTLPQLSKDYYESEGESIPWKDLGYLSLLNFLQSMPGSVEVEFRNNTFCVKGIASEKSKHVSKLVAGQKDQSHGIGRRLYRPTHMFPKTLPQKVHIPAEILTMIISYVNDHPDGVNKDYVLQIVQSHMPHANISMSDMEEQLYKLSHKIRQSHNKIFPIESKSRNLNLKSTIVTASGEEDSDDMLDYEEDDFGFAPSGYKSHLYETKSIPKTKPTSSFIKETVSKCQDQDTENRISEYTSRLQTYQTDSFDSHNYNCNDNVQTQIEFNNNLEKENYFDGNNVDILINERVKFRLEKLIQSHPNGIWCADLPEKYLQEYKVSLNYTELGFNSVREFASQLPEIFHCVQPDDTGDFMLYYAKQEVPLSKQKEKQKTINLTELHHIYEKDDEAEALPTTLSLDTCKKLIPDGIVTIGECVGQINVDDLVDIEKPYIEVVVVEVFTPSFFWIQLRKKQKAFKTFMEDLHDFYSRTYDQYAIPPVILEKGLNCACMYNGIWHRAIIKTVKPDLQVTVSMEVLFYDYGTLKTYPPNAVFYLHRMFSSLPAQAIPCGLINTKPYKGSKWSRSATHHFAVKTSQIPLVATIATINTEDNSMMVTLTDTSEDEDVHINDWLVEQQFAQHGKMVCKKNRNFLFQYYLECQERSKRMSKISETSEKVQPLKHDKPTSFENYSESKVALYNNNKVNSISCKTKNKTAQFVKCHNSSRSGSTVEERCCSTLSSEKKSPEKKSLYDILINFKQNSYSHGSSNTKFHNNIESYESSSSNLVMNEIGKEKLYEESLNNNIEGNKKCGISSSTFKCLGDTKVGDKKVNEGKEYDILKKFSNIPKAYAYHFHIQDPENELDVMRGRTYTDTCYKQSEFEEVDWSVIRKNIECVEQRKECLLQQDVTKTTYKSMPVKRDNIPLAESCFLKAVRNSTHYASRDEDTRWLPSGNVNQAQGASPLILKNIKKRVNSIEKEKIIAIPREVLEILTGKELTRNSHDSLINTFNTNEAQSSSSSQGVSSVTADDSSYSSNNSTFYIETSQSSSDNSVSRFGNHYLFMKVHSSRYKLLQRALANQNISSKTSSLDSDDLSVSEISISPEKNTSNIGEKSPLEEHENDRLQSTTTESTSLNMIDSSANSRNESYEALLSSETSVGAEELMSIEPVFTQQQAVVEEMLTEEESTTESVEMENEMISTELIPRRELLPPDTINNKSSIPVFNDIDLESDEEEWDVQLSFTDVCDFLKINCPFRKSIEAYRRLEQESNACLKIEEIDDSNPFETRNTLDEKQENNIKEMTHSTDSVEIPDNTEQLSVESDNLMDQYEESIETQRSVSKSEQNFQISGKDNSYSIKAGLMSCKSQGKAKTLVDMLNKVKLLQNE